jgi:ABC-type antimicrobial peptide transport system permease subunit
VVGDVKQTSLALANPDAVYITADQWYFADALRTLVVRARGDAAALTPEVTRAIRSVDRDRPIIRVATMERLVSASVAEQRFALTIFGAFAIAALALAAAGIYGVMSGSVTERTREIGVRSALGASRSEIVGLVMRQGMSLCAMGAVIGLVAAFASSGALGSLLFGISRLDAVTHVAVVLALLGVSAIACWVPAWRAARVDPAITLRGE